ncbi:unnamed protein product, partial [marine sediment metagenome]
DWTPTTHLVRLTYLIARSSPHKWMKRDSAGCYLA